MPNLDQLVQLEWMWFVLRYGKTNQRPPLSTRVSPYERLRFFAGRHFFINTDFIILINLRQIKLSDWIFLISILRKLVAAVRISDLEIWQPQFRLFKLMKYLVSINVERLVRLLEIPYFWSSTESSTTGNEIKISMEFLKK